jgi:hypothetical protein
MSDKRAGHVLVSILALCAFLCPQAESASARKVVGEYRNPSRGFAVTVPRECRGTTGEAAGPETGVGIWIDAVSCVSVYAEPNSLEWDTPRDGARQWAEWYGVRDADVAPGKLGDLPAATATIMVREGVLSCRLAFRPGGGLIYWAVLRSTRSNLARDLRRFDEIARTFRLLAWE